MKNYFRKQIFTKKGKRGSLLFILIFALAVFLRIVYLEDIPLLVDGDGSRFGLEGLRVWKERSPLFSTGWFGHTHALFYIIGLFIRIFNHRLIGLRVFSALGGILGVLATYLFVKESLNKKAALWAALFLSVSPFHLVFSRVGTEAVWTTFFAPISLFLLLKKKSLNSLLAGFSAGLAQYFYPGARLIPILNIALWLILLINKKLTLRKFINCLGFYLLGFLLIYGPMIHYYSFRPVKYWERVNIVGIFQSGWLEKELAKRSAQEIFFKQIVNNLSIFHLPIKTGLAWFYRTPFLTYLSSFFFTIGLIIGLLKIRTWPSQLLSFYLGTGIFLGGVLTVDSPSPSRSTVLFPAIACFLGLGIERFIDFANQILRKKNFPLAVFLAGFFTVFNLYSYRQHEKIDTWQHDFNTQTATFAARYLSHFSEDYQIFFVGDSSLYYEAIRTLPFLTGKEGKDIFGPVEDELDNLDPSVQNIFIVLPQREEALEVFENEFPWQSSQPFYNPQGKLLFWLIKI
jgi:4-amino-4-deoxy-L-arabinose transferase-like glycosyltransferase